MEEAERAYDADNWAGGYEEGAASDDITGAAPVSPELPVTGQADPTVGVGVPPIPRYLPHPPVAALACAGDHVIVHEDAHVLNGDWEAIRVEG